MSEVSGSELSSNVGDFLDHSHDALALCLQEALVQIKIENYASALPLLNTCLEDSTIDHHQRTMALYFRGLIRTHNDDWHGAITDYTTALQIQEATYTQKIQFGLGMAYVAIGEYHSALTTVASLVQSEPDHAAAQQLLGLIYKKLWQQNPHNIGYLNSAIQAYQKAASVFLHQQDELNCRRCIAAYQELQQSLPPTPAGLLDSAAQKIKTSDWLGALIDLNFVVQLAEDNPPLKAKGMALRGMVHSKLRNLTSAMADLNQALVISPDDVEVRLTRGMIRLEMADTQGAIEDFTALLREESGLPQAYISRGLAYQKQKEYRQAIEDFSRGLSLEQQPQWYCDRGQARYDFGDIRGAVDDYQQAANLWFNQTPTTSNHMAAYQKAIDQIKRWQIDLANQQRQAARQREQATASLVNNLNQMPSLLRLVGGNMAIAQRLLEIAKQEHPQMPEAWYWQKVIFDIESNLPEE